MKQVLCTFINDIFNSKHHKILSECREKNLYDYYMYTQLNRTTIKEIIVKDHLNKNLCRSLAYDNFRCLRNIQKYFDKCDNNL